MFDRRHIWAPLAGLAGGLLAAPAQAQLGLTPVEVISSLSAAPLGITSTGTGWTYTHNSLSSGIGIAIKATPGVLHGVFVNGGITAGNVPTITVFDGSSATGAIIGILTPNVLGATAQVIYDVAFLTSLTVIFATSSAAYDATVAWK